MISAFSSENHQNHTRIPSEANNTWDFIQATNTWIPSKPTNQSHLIPKKSKPLLTMSTVDISVLHSAEVVHFYCES